MEGEQMHSTSKSPVYPSLEVPALHYDVAVGFLDPSTPCNAQYLDPTYTLDCGIVPFASASPLYQMQEMIPVESVDSTSLDERDRCRQISKTSKDAENLSSMHLRRRAQNRASQRAFRERKEKRVQSLMEQLQYLHDQHKELLQSYSRQAKEISKLHEKVKELTVELQSLKTTNNLSWPEAISLEDPQAFTALSQSLLADFEDMSQAHYFPPSLPNEIN